MRFDGTAATPPTDDASSPASGQPPAVRRGRGFRARGQARSASFAVLAGVLCSVATTPAVAAADTSTPHAAWRDELRRGCDQGPGGDAWHDCLNRAYLDSGRVPPADVARCEAHAAARGSSSRSSLWMCLSRAVDQAERDARRAGPASAAAIDTPAARPGAAAPGMRQRAACETWGKANLPAADYDGFYMRCAAAKEPPDLVAERIKAERAPSPSSSSAPADGAGLGNGHRQWCDTNNRAGGGLLHFDCDCVVAEGDRHLRAGRIPAEALARHEFDMAPCIDRERSADKYVSRQAGAETAMAAMGIDVEALRACRRDAIAKRIDAASLLDTGRTTAELSRLCTPQRKR